jgi:hypothetical protein
MECSIPYSRIGNHNTAHRSPSLSRIAHLQLYTQVLVYEELVPFPSARFALPHLSTHPLPGSLPPVSHVSVMSDSSPWSSNPNAPQTPYGLYLAEKELPELSSARYSIVRRPMPTSICAHLVCPTVAPGIAIVVFFRCTEALLNPTNRRTKEGIKWGLVAHTTVTFSFVTIANAMNFHLLSVCYTDNREFTGVDGVAWYSPDPLGLGSSSGYPKAIGVVPGVMLLLNNWLADGLWYALFQTRFPRSLT